MTTIAVLPGLDLDDELYNLAADALRDHRGDCDRCVDLAPLTWQRFTDPASWALIPAPDGHAYKADCVLSPDVRVVYWMRPDERDPAGPRPHNHPWRWFRSKILRGGYTETRWDTDQPGVPVAYTATHQAGDVNVVLHTTYHEVVGLLMPGTCTFLVSGPGTPNDWGYLDLDTGRHCPYEVDPGFDARFAALNPHRR
jgi:hypothetical protein